MVLVVWDYGKEKMTSQKVCNNAESKGLCNVLCIFLPDYLKGCQRDWNKCMAVAC